MNKLIIIIIFTLNFLLSNATEPVNTDDKEKKRIENLKPLELTPLYLPDVDEFKKKYPEKFEQTQSVQENVPQKKVIPFVKPPEWILEASMENAPNLLKGIFFYLQLRQYCIDQSFFYTNVPSFHRFILVGPPGTGKTTLAHAIAHMLHYPIIFIAATSLLGHFRNETAMNIRRVLKELSSNESPKVIIIDELHKLFEHHTNDRSDDSQSAAAFWLVLDDIEKYSPNTIVIGTANSVEKLPPEIKSRFSGKIISMSSLNRDQKIQMFKNSIMYGQSIAIDESIDDAFIGRMLQQIDNCSLRDIQLIIDSAKMFYYAEQPVYTIDFPFIVLTQNHFQQALDQLQAESQVLQKKVTERMYEKIQKWGLPISVALNLLLFIKETMLLFNDPKGFIKTVGY